MTRARSLSKLVNEQSFTVDSDFNIGVNSTSPVEKLNVVGVVSATSFYGDGSNLEGVSSAGLGTALAEEGTLSVVYYTDNVLTVGSTITVDPPTSTNVAYTQYAEIALSGDADLIVGDGDDFIPDVLGLSTEGVTALSGTGGRVRADNFTNKAGTGAPTFQTGLNVTGVTTSTGGFVGNLTGNVTGNASGLTGTPDITVGNITGVAATFTGVLTYEDVTNIDSVGIITAQSGLRVLGAGVTVAGISTFHDGADIEGFKIEDGQTAATPNGEFNFYLSDGHFFRYTGTAGANYYPNFKHSASVNLNDRMDVNDVVTATLVVNSATTSYYIANTIHIDGNATGENSYTIDTDWVGGSAPSAGNGSGHDVYSFTIIKTADKTFTIIANSVAAA